MSSIKIWVKCCGSCITIHNFFLFQYENFHLIFSEEMEAQMHCIITVFGWFVDFECFWWTPWGAGRGFAWQVFFGGQGVRILLGPKTFQVWGHWGLNVLTRKIARSAHTYSVYSTLFRCVTRATENFIQSWVWVQKYKTLFNNITMISRKIQIFLALGFQLVTLANCPKSGPIRVHLSVS